MSTTTTPLISISIPVFKCENYILRCLNSVKSQTYKNLEIILVNDCTPDNSLELIEKFITENPNLNIKIIHNPSNQGLSVVRNVGIEHSNGEYIFFLDSDDAISPNCIETLLNTAVQTKAQVTIGQNRWINTFNNTTKDFGFPTNTKQSIYKGNYEIFKAYVSNVFPITSWNKLFERHFITSNNIYFIPGLYAQDELWFFHLMLKTESVAINFEITYDYYLHKDSVIFNRTKRNFENYQTILEYFHKSYKEAKPDIKKLIKIKVIRFKETVLIMQWRALKGDFNYLKENYGKMKKFPKLTLWDYLDNFFDFKLKKMNFLQNLPSWLGAKIFLKRFG